MGRSLSLVALVLLLPAVALGQRAEQKPRELSNVQITPRFDAQIPLDMEFTDSNGQKITLAQVFDGTKPVILTMNYSNCPMLCSLQLNGLVAALRDMRWTAGEEFRLVTVSIDPLETPERAQLTKEKYLKDYGRAKSPDAWRFLVTRREEQIRKLADTVGFGYSRGPDGTYLHSATLILCTPDGRVARYLGGVQYEPESLRLALYESGEGTVGSSWNQVLLFCYQYDGQEGYALAAMRLMQAGGALTMIVLGTTLFVFWRRDRARRATDTPPGGDA